MNDQYERQLVRELEVHAEIPTVAPGLAGHLIDRAHVVRRRRQAVVASVAAVGAVAGILLAANGFGGTGRGSSHPVGRTPGPTVAPTATDSSAPVAPTQLTRLPLRGKGNPGTALSPMPYVAANQVSIGGSGYRVPAGWTVLSITSAGDGLVLHVGLVTATGNLSGGDFVGYLSPDGLVRRIPGAQVPFFVNPTGTLLVATTDAGRDLPPGVEERLVSFELPSVTALPVAALGPGLRVQGFAGEDLLVVASQAGAAQLWHPATGAGTPLAAGTTVLAANAHGDRLLSTGQEVIAQTADGAERWRSLPFGDVIGYSPPGDLLAAFAPAGRPTGITIRDFGSGQELVHFGLKPANRPGPADALWAGWADDRTLIVQTGGDQGADARYARCTIGTATCVDLGVIRGQLELPGQAFFD